MRGHIDTPTNIGWKGIAYGCAVVVLFSGFVLVSRFGLSSTVMTLPDIAALRFGIGALVLMPILVKHGLSGLRITEAIALAVLGGLGFGLFAYAGFALAPAAHGSVLIHGTLSLTTAMLAALLHGGVIRKRKRIALCLIAVGVLAMAWDGLSRSSPALIVGDICLLAASFCWSGYGLYVSRLGLAAPRAAAVVAGVSALIFLPVYATLPNRMLLEADWRDLIVQGVFQGVLIGALSVFVYTRAVALLGAARISFFTAAVPVLTSLAAFVLLGELPGLAAAAGVALVTAGMIAGLVRAS